MDGPGGHAPTSYMGPQINQRVARWKLNADPHRLELAEGALYFGGPLPIWGYWKSERYGRKPMCRGPKTL